MESGHKFYTDILSLDIETLAAGERLTIEEMKDNHPKTMSKEETILKWCEDNIEKEYKDRALKSTKGRLCCISLKWGSDPAIIIPYQEDEKAMLLELLKEFKSKNNMIYSCAIIGNRIKEFDLKWILHRAFKYDIKELIMMLPTTKFDGRIQDLSGIFNQFDNREHTSLKDICEFLGVKSPKGELDGSKVHDYFQEGRLEEIYTYCKGDTTAGYECYLKMQVTDKDK